MSSFAGADWLDLERDHPTTSEDVAALRLLRRHAPMDLDGYLRFLRSFPAATVDELARRKGPRGREPFALPPIESPD
jgi:hypothetical protein